MLALRSHSHDVTGVVQAISRRMLIFGNRAKQSLIATAGEAGLNCGSIAKALFTRTRGRVALLPG